MSTATFASAARSILRYSSWDALLIALALAHGALLIAVPTAPLIAMGVWWNSNTISHNFVHNPFFRSRLLNRVFSLYLSLILGIPQTIWRGRHIAHHANATWKLQVSGLMVAEITLVICLWGFLTWHNSTFLLSQYFPGYVVGLGLCAVHGHYEHVRGGTVSHYGWLYNLLFLNDGYHVEHHVRPGTHWAMLPRHVEAVAQKSHWPAVLRWLDAFSLDSLERLVLRSRLLQDFVIRKHAQALRKLLPTCTDPHRVAIVGGGLFPRTAIILRHLLPRAKLVVIDANAENLRIAGAFLDPTVEIVHAKYDPLRHDGFDLVVIPLAYLGDREACYRNPRASTTIIHDWIWRPRGLSTVVSSLLFKRLNLVAAPQNSALNDPSAQTTAMAQTVVHALAGQ